MERVVIVYNLDYLCDVYGLDRDRSIDAWLALGSSIWVVSATLGLPIGAPVTSCWMPTIRAISYSSGALPMIGKP